MENYSLSKVYLPGYQFPTLVIIFELLCNFFKLLNIKSFINSVLSINDLIDLLLPKVSLSL